TVKNYVTDSGYLNFGTPILLHLSPNVKPVYVDEDSPCINNGSQFEITIDGTHIYTNFHHDVIYMKYYGFPTSKDTGLPLIPNINAVEKAIEWYIIWQSLLSLWFNSEVPDLQNKYKEAEQHYNFWFAQALYEVKLPTFQALVDKIRLNRKYLSTYQIDSYGSQHHHP